MTLPLRRLQFGIVVAVIVTDCVWQWIGHFDVDVPAYLTLGGLALTLALGGWFYEHIRKDAGLSGMLLGASFLIAFSASFAVLNYFLLTVAGARVDNLLAAMDRAMGVDWPVMLEFAAAHPALNFILWIAYSSVLPQIAFLIVCLGWKARRDEIGLFCLALASGAILTVFIWTLFPSFGAFAVYDLPPQIANGLALDADYAHALVELLASGPGRISPHDIRGLIGFPSFHVALAILVTWYARSWKAIQMPLILLNLVVLVATPIQGGHHVIDVLGGVAVAALAIVFAAWIGALSERNAATPRARLARMAAKSGLSDSGDAMSLSTDWK